MKQTFILIIMLIIAVSCLTAVETLQINYHRYDKQYTGWGLHVWGSGYAGETVEWGKALQPKSISEYGAVWEITYSGNGDIQFIIHKGDLKDPDGDRSYPNPKDNKVIWTINEDANNYTTLAEAQANASDMVKIAPGQANKSVRLYYIRFDNQYNGWGLHAWGDGYDGATVNWNAALKPTGTSDKGIYWDLPYKGTGTLNFIVHNGDQKDIGTDRKFPLPAANKEAFLITSDPAVYTKYDDVKKNTANRIEKAIITSENEITVEFRSKPQSALSVLLNDKPLTITKQTSVSDTKVILQVTEKLDIAQKYQIKCGEMTVFSSTDWKSIDALYSYDGALGCFYTPSNTEFKLWSPLASSVVLNLFHQGDEMTPYKKIAMVKGDKGVWNTKLTEDLINRFYTYSVTNNGMTKEVLDPYAKSMAAFNSESKDNIGKGAIVNPSTIGPKLQYANIDGYTKREDTIIYEVHVRDFTSDPNLTTTAQFGTYKAFIEKLDYIKSLGVTHIQLLPIMNFYFGNELNNGVRETQYSASNNNYNWGYDPHSYFTPEGMYSINPADPQLRMAELKELINEIHKRGMGVVLDNVYNHTAKLTILEDIIPNYYHFMDKDGKPKLSYGGGRPGSTHYMTRKLIHDSILYWVNEYKVDGFRFDLMGDLDAETVQIAFDKAKLLNPNIVFIGEGWKTYSGDDGDKRTAADQDWVGQSDAVGCFSDEFRNDLKSGFGSEGQPRFITGGARNVQTIFNNVIGKPGNMKEDDPGDVVQYIEAHDNLTLHDIIAVTLKKDPDVMTDENEIHKRIRLGNALVLTSQGIAFLHAGQEYGRTKQWRAPGKPQDKFTTVSSIQYPHFIQDSYDASDAINKFDWQKVVNPGVSQQTMAYTSGLIKLRRSTDAFRLGNETLVKSNIQMIPCPDIRSNDVVIAYQCQSTDGTKYFVFVNGDNRPRQFNTSLDLKGSEIIVDDDEAGMDKVANPTGVKINANRIVELAPLTVTVLRQRK